MVETVEQERTISGRGLFKIDDNFRECKRILLYATVIRPPKNPYLNVTWNPNKGFYANITLAYRGFVIAEIPMNFPKQAFKIHENDSQQVGASLVCALDNILDSFVQYAIAAGIPYTKNNSIEEFGYSAFIYDECRFVCYSGTALALQLIGEKVEKCDPEDAPANYPPPPPPPEQPPVPPGTPVEVSPPYEPDSPDSPDGDNGDTQPDPTDTTGEPPFDGDFPFGDRCERYLCIAEITSDSAPTRRRESVFFGEIEDFRFNPEINGQPSSITIRAYGLPLPEGDDVCNAFPTDYIFLQSSLGEVTEGTIISVELIV